MDARWLAEGYTGVPDVDVLAIIQHMHGCGRGEAEFILAIERGEIDGDIEVVEAQEMLPA